jgi:hypothetical protein
VLYRSEAEHSRDCEEYPYESIPGRVFLDTNVVNALVKHAGHIFEQEPLTDGLNQTMAHDVEALMHVFQIGSRANWDLVASSKTLEEISQTPIEELRETLMDYAVEIAECSARQPTLRWIWVGGSSGPRSSTSCPTPTTARFSRTRLAFSATSSVPATGARSSGAAIVCPICRSES